MNADIRNYAIVTGNYWAFTLTDGALRMLVLLHFHQLGYTPLQIAMLFLFYEVFGIVTNAVGGWLGARIGVNRTMQIGTALQIISLALLLAPAAWLTVPYVMAAQALSGIAKDLNKMSAKSSVKLVAGEGSLFRWVAILTGSKNALKGVGFFLGGLLLAVWGFHGALWAMIALLAAGLAVTLTLPGGLGVVKGKPTFGQVFSNTPAINGLAAARFFLFGARDVWFVVGLPVYLHAVLGWGFTEVGGFLALWVIGYGIVQAATPGLWRRPGRSPGRAAVVTGTLGLALIPLAMAWALTAGLAPAPVVIGGLALFGVVFALNSSIHSYLILAYAEGDKVAMKVGFYYMANAGGRLAGTVLSGWAYQVWGLEGCLVASGALLLAAAGLSIKLPAHTVSRSTPA
ncbi:MAG: organoarsenical effux MFS transporter ArsJ [Halothiobacillaceae bacterium]|nr:MAG: organoarsenical effux MFS transporter ArsJ [Halothiobacillaceae bacterium]